MTRNNELAYFLRENFMLLENFELLDAMSVSYIRHYIDRASTRNKGDARHRSGSRTRMLREVLLLKKDRRFTPESYWEALARIYPNREIRSGFFDA